jgi:DNA-binding NarL/FixJ family response regulator
MIKIALTDDHHLVRSGLKLLVESIPNFKVIMEASNGKDLLAQLASAAILPQIILCDISMHPMNGIEVTKIITKNYPAIFVIALTVHDDKSHINQMIEAGARAYLLKESSPEIVAITIQNVLQSGSYFTKEIMQKIIASKASSTIDDQEHTLAYDLIALLTEREKEFIYWSCSEYNYKGIANQMKISLNTVNGYRESVFEKLHVNSRIGLILFAVNHNLHVLS